MTVHFDPYRARTVLNVHQHADGWFWDKYTAHPYVGCRSDCAFCYARGGKYARNPEEYATRIRVKENAVDLLRRQLQRREPDVICCGDWQMPAERRFRLSRGMLEVVHDLAFPLLVIERSHALLDDLDLLAAIHTRSVVRVLVSISSLDPEVKRAFEPKSPGVRRRLEMIGRLAARGIPVGCSFMPILPEIADDARSIGAVVAAVAEMGGSYVVASGLTMAGLQRELTFQAAGRMGREEAMRAHYQRGSGWQADYHRRINDLVREQCERHGLSDRMPRPILPGPRATNRRIAEKLHNRAWELELEDPRRAWAYRRAAWTIDECAQEVGVLHAEAGADGLRTLPGIGAKLSRQIAGWLEHA